jgi:glutamate/tyrosine decarboxylase-like PLP-dependent enzyme
MAKVKTERELLEDIAESLAALRAMAEGTQALLAQVMEVAAPMVARIQQEGVMALLAPPGDGVAGGFFGGPAPILTDGSADGY